MTQQEVDYLSRAFEHVQGPILDLGCGHGRHAARLIAHRVVGVELDALSLEERLEGFPAVRADFFRLPFANGSCAAAYGWYSSLFSFEDSQQLPLFEEIARCLKPGGLLLLQTVPVSCLASEPSASFERKLPDGTILSEKTRFNARTGRDEGVRLLTFPDGRVLSAPFFIRYYPAPELSELLHRAGFQVRFIHGDLQQKPLTNSSRELILGAERTHG